MTRHKQLILIFGSFIALYLLVALAVWTRLHPRVVSHRHAAAPATPMPGKRFADELACDLYDCTLTLTAGAPLPSGRVRVLLEGGRGNNYTILTISAQTLAISTMQDGKEHAYAQVHADITAGTPYHLTILRRGERLGLLHDGALLYVGNIPHAEGSGASIESGNGWKVADLDAHALEPVGFADDFMRNAEEPGAWKTENGNWRLQSAWDEDPHGNAINRFQYTIYAQNPFAWIGMANGSAALCTTGRTSWEDYTCAAAVRPGKRGAVGLAVNLSDAKNGYLARWSAASDHGPHGDRLQLIKLTDGRPTVLKETRGGYLPGQWYRLSAISSLDGIQVLIDGEERLNVPKITPWCGMVGLYVDGPDAATFDDVTVYGSTLKTHLLAENAQETIKQGFLKDRQGMQQWSNTDYDWSYQGGGMRVQQHEFYGDHWMVLKVIPEAGNYGQLIMALNSNRGQMNSGSRAVIDPSDASGNVKYTLYRDNTVLAQMTGVRLNAGEEYSFRLQRTGKRLKLECDGEVILDADDPQPVIAHYPAYQVSGCYANARNIYVLGGNFLDYTFTNAPVDWVGDGTWLATMRWACMPKWSFYSGWSRGDAVLWHKRRFYGDQSLQAFTAFKMEYPRETNFYDQKIRYHDACITICGDGRDPRSGYALVSGLPDTFGTPNARTVLYRNGQQVAESSTSIVGWGANHSWWYDMELNKHGDTVEFLLKGQPVISYRDPHPIDGGIPAIWTTDNGLSIARVRIHYAGTAPLNRDPRVYLDNPWFPEWADVGTPLTLDFPDAFATTGKSVLLQVKERQAPPNSPLPYVQDRRVIFTPRSAGSYWYQLTASDGSVASPAFNLFMPAFNPALGRDDSHALLLYHFNERAGSIVRDYSRIGAPVDLHIPADTSTCWLPTQGLTFHGRKPLSTEGNLRKLMAIKRQGACTIEMWVSTDSSYPPDHWLGVPLAWDNGRRRNFLVGIHMNTLAFTPPSGNFRRGPSIDNYPDLEGSCANYGLRTGLQHLVITWDGVTTREYANGQYIGELQIPWEPERWDADARLLLGNQPDNQRTYLGTYYLLAIHDKCFPTEQVRRHYEAGPTAK